MRSDTFGKFWNFRGAYGQGYLGFAKMYLELLELLLELLLQLLLKLQQQLQQLQVHFGETQVTLATGTLMCSREKWLPSRRRQIFRYHYEFFI